MKKTTKKTRKWQPDDWWRDVYLCGGPSALSQSGRAREYSRKADVPRKEVWDCPKYLYKLKRKDA